MNRAVVTADLHFSLYGQDSKMENGMGETLYYLDNVMRNSILKYADDENISNCIIVGDIFHNKSIIHAKALAVFIDIVNDFSHINFILLDGNHDHSKMSGDDVTSLKSLENTPNVNVIHDAVQKNNLYFVPWNNKLIENIKNPPNGVDYLFSHFGLNEGTLSSGISIISDIGLKDLKPYKYVILGHYHKPQYIKNDFLELYYVGSPIQLDMGERDEEKRFLDINFETNEIKSIKTDGYKKYYKIELAKQDAQIIKEIEFLQKQGHDVLVEITNDIDTSSIPENVRIVNKVDIDITNRGISLDMSESERLEAYLNIKEIPDNKKEDYLSIAKYIINFSKES